MKLIKQRTGSDCGVACMAMVVGCSYEEAKECYDYQAGCAHTLSMEKFLNKYELSLYVRNQVTDSDTVAYLLNCKSPAGAHWVVMTTTGEFYDPSPTPLNEYQRVNFYKIKPLKCQDEAS